MWWGGEYSGTGGEATQASLHSFPSSGSLSICLSPLPPPSPFSYILYSTPAPLFINESVPSKHKNFLGNKAMIFLVFHWTENYPIWSARPVLSILSCRIFHVQSDLSYFVWYILSSVIYPVLSASIFSFMIYPVLSGPVSFLSVFLVLWALSFVPSDSQSLALSNFVVLSESVLSRRILSGQIYTYCHTGSCPYPFLLYPLSDLSLFLSWDRILEQHF